MKLIIVESPTKARTISKFLGDDYVIKASMGHVMDLPKSKLGVDVDHDFQADFEISPDKKKTIAELKKFAKDADDIILATDPDREGEAIAAHIEELIADSKWQMEKKNEKKNHKPSAISHKPMQRIVFHEITKTAIEEALAHPGIVNQHLVDAQTARRVLDRLVGYKLSPILWKKVRRGLSAGRVQSVALRLIVEREREIEKFVKEKYWTISVILVNSRNVIASSRGPGNDGIDFELVEISGEKIETTQKFTLYDGEYTTSKTTIDTEEKAKKIKSDLVQKIFIVSDVLKKETKRSPQPPFTTSTLQQQAAGRFGYSGKRTMSLAQKLYEEGFITYHRTDSVHMSTAAVSQMREYVEKSFGKAYIPEKPRFFAAKQKLAQEAHEAIRPTKAGVLPTTISDQLGSAYGKMYELIWRRAIASQMSDAITESTTVFADADIYRFKTTGSVLLFEGFLKINPFGLQDRKLPQFIAKEKLDFISATTEEHETPAPPRYNDASLIKSLEEEGIGRPSTYATIIGTIEARNYIERDQGRFLPTSVGMTVNDFLVKHFSDIDDIPFTAAMEDGLDAIANEGKPWKPMIRDFYTPFAKQLTLVDKAERVHIPVEETSELCPKDGGPLVIRMGRFGKFISCKNFPTCDFKKPFIEETNFICPKDGGKVIVKKTKKGRTFYGCGNYPKCDFAVWKISELKNAGEPRPTESGKEEIKN